jgi:hypothetical protein
VSSFIQRHEQDQREEKQKRTKDNVYIEQRRGECVRIYVDRRTLEKKKKPV